ncbi:hypothetical protein [Paenibacillus apiarius]|uniref:hypothetical protein n=1 Tax=Paenibacillus apiarius TaxID=46240 RepID=UPI003B3BCEAE
MSVNPADYYNELTGLLPPGAAIALLPNNRPAYIAADMDGDGQNEIVAVYKEQGEFYVAIFKRYDGAWEKLKVIKGSGYNVTHLLAAPITGSKAQDIIVGWQIGSIWSELDGWTWTPDSFKPLFPSGIYFSKLEVEDMPSALGKDGKSELALWEHDTGDAYKVGVYRWSPTGLIAAKDVYPYYFRKVAAYYEAMVKNFPSYSFYWYYLADAQAKAGMTKLAIQTIEHALRFPHPYPSQEKLLQLKQELEQIQPRPMAEFSGMNSRIFAMENGDVNRDGVADRVFLTGNKPFGEGSPFIDHIALFVQEGHTKNVTKLPLAETAGYNPTIFLGDFTGDKTDDICIVIDAGGSGGIIYANLFSYWNWKYHLIFDSETFNATKGNYDVMYKDNYKVEVINRQLYTKYTIDIAYKGADYLASIYDQGGKLIKPMTGEVGNIGGLYPIDYERDGIYDLTAAQNIMGQYQADRLGIVNTVLHWNGMAFIPIRQYVQIYGSKLQS